jgi:hypothetical protein
LVPHHEVLVISIKELTIERHDGIDINIADRDRRARRFESILTRTEGRERICLSTGDIWMPRGRLSVWLDGATLGIGVLWNSIYELVVRVRTLNGFRGVY